MVLLEAAGKKVAREAAEENEWDMEFVAEE